MDRTEKRKLAVVFLLILLLAFYVDITGGNIQEDGSIKRNEFGGKDKSVHLVIDAEGIVENYSYELEVEPTRISEEEAEQYIAKAMEEIDADFKEIKADVEIQDTYVSGFVEADWYFSPSGYLSSEGQVVQENIPEEGILINARVTLLCGDYEAVYSFPFRIEKEILSEQERFFNQVDEWIEKQMKQEGTTSIILPDEINGINIIWSEKKDYLAVKIMLLEIVAIVLISISKKRKLEKENQERKRSIELQYPDVVNQLSILLEAGMTTRQAWQRMAKQYTEKRQRNLVEENLVYEAITHMSHRLAEGENEKIAYEKFLGEIDVMCYHRLFRTLIGNLEKGTSSICNYLEEESRRAYEQRIFLAKKIGEEASTKMLFPLMIMMILVMAMVVAPAIISFSI